jgi:integrase
MIIKPGKRGKGYGVRVYAAGRQDWVGTYRTLQEAREAEREAHARRQPRASESCGSFARRWVEDYPRGAAATKRTYRYALRAFARDFDKVRLRDVDRPMAREWALRQPKANVFVVRSMFGDALRDGLCTINPFSDLRLEQSRGRKDIVALTESELQELAGHAREVHGEYGATFAAMIIFAGYVGLRPAELFALEHVDVTAGRVHVRQSLDATGQLKLPKNGRTREVVLPPPARDALRSMPRRVDTPLAFTTKRGKRFTKPALNLYWAPVRAAFGRPRMHFYELRHFCATHLLELGCSHADVAVQLGHTDGGKLVMSTYGHPSEAAARERLARAFTPKVTPLRVADGSQPAVDSA